MTRETASSRGLHRTDFQMIHLIIEFQTIPPLSLSRSLSADPHQVHSLYCVQAYFFSFTNTIWTTRSFMRNSTGSTSECFFVIV
jgi:hypothetical protein